ncbi:hypothetical protein FRUB_06622 [Fimbriiglobus ruber]|uniref:Uncharacterized protein n=1 Tax=Fimbriiglobus ruber TaxID=1908690 RepID=A0A225D7S2_9BACT|nr:hypothetical protein FRUB_06622 [Fimbriiglobus ruber]
MLLRPRLARGQPGIDQGPESGDEPYDSEPRNSRTGVHGQYPDTATVGPAFRRRAAGRALDRHYCK